MQKEVLGCFLHSLPVATEVTVMSSWVDSSLYPYLWAVRMIWTLFGLGRKSERYLTGFPWYIRYRMSLISTYGLHISRNCPFLAENGHRDVGDIKSMTIIGSWWHKVGDNYCKLVTELRSGNSSDNLEWSVVWKIWAKK